VRVSNELGAHPRVAKFSVFVMNGNSMLISVVFAANILILRVGLSHLFTSDSEVIEAVSDLTPLLAISVLLNGIQPILSGNTVISRTHQFKFFHTSESDPSFCLLLLEKFQGLQLDVDGKLWWLM
jgi:hypothetical protein